MPTKNLPKITIIGGGILGLTLAYLLAKQQYKIRLVERSSSLGGLASSFSINGSYLERYYHHFFKSDTYLQDLLKELGLQDHIQWLPSKMGIYDGKQLYAFSQALDILSFPALNIFERLRLGIVSFYLQKKKPDVKLAKITALDWCRKFYGKAVTDKIWEPLLRSKFEDKFDKISMDWFHIRIHDRSSSRSQPFKDETLGYIKGSFQVLIQAIEEKLRALNVEILLNTQVEEYIYVKDDHILKVDSKGKKRTLRSDIVIANTPPKVFKDIFKPSKKYTQELEAIDFLGAYCFVVEMDKSLSPFYWTSVNDPKAPFVALVEHTNLIDKSNFKGSNIVYLGKYTRTDSRLYTMNEETLWKECFSYLKKLHPALNQSNIKSKYLFKAPQAQHIVTINHSVLSYETGRKGLLFSHFAQIYPHDRGTNYAIAQAYELFNLISSRKWN